MASVDRVVVAIPTRRAKVPDCEVQSRRDPPHALARFERGRLELLRGDLEASEQAMRDAAAGFGSAGALAAWRQAAALRQLAVVVHMRGRPEQVRQLHAQARELERRDDTTQPSIDQGQTSLREGLAHVESGAFDRAQASFRSS